MRPRIDDDERCSPTTPDSITDVLQCRRCCTPGFRERAGPFVCDTCGHDTPEAGRVPRVAAIALALVAPLDEYAAAEVLFELRYGGRWGCADCGHRRATHLRTRPRLFECNACGKAASVTAGTALHGCKVPLTKVVLAAQLLCWARTSISARELAKALGVAIETAWSLGHRLRSGLLEQRVRLVGELILSSCQFKLRPPPRQSRPRGQRFATFKILWDRSQHFAVETGSPDHHGLRRFVDRHAEVDRPILGTYRLRHDPCIIGNHTHGGVSDRWLPFYANAVAGWQNAWLDERHTPTLTLQGALRCTRHPFARLRPRQPPSRSLSDWRQWDRDVELLREWGLLPTPEPAEAP